MLDVTVEEAKRLTEIQYLISRKYAGSEKLLTRWGQMRQELVNLCNEAGFEVEVRMREVNGNWVPECDVVGRTDKALEATVRREGEDFERRHWEALRESSAELEAKGVNTDLLG